MIRMEKAARYLLRFDDISPGMNWRVWEQIEQLLLELNLSALLAVVPDNRDPKLEIDARPKDFWERARRWQQRGHSIALHGYQHLYSTRSSGLMRLTPQSEFAGLPLDEQRHKITQGVKILSSNGLHTEAWVAPSHSFDRNTIVALLENGISVISDGLWPFPHRENSGALWVPQQMWEKFKRRSSGVWTVCFHHNSWSASQFAGFENAVRAHQQRIHSFQRVATEFSQRRITLSDQAYAWFDLVRTHRLRRAAVRARACVRR